MVTITNDINNTLSSLKSPNISKLTVKQQKHHQKDQQFNVKLNKYLDYKANEYINQNPTPFGTTFVKPPVFVLNDLVYLPDSIAWGQIKIGQDFINTMIKTDSGAKNLNLISGPFYSYLQSLAKENGIKFRQTSCNMKVKGIVDTKITSLLHLFFRFKNDGLLQEIPFKIKENLKWPLLICNNITPVSSIITPNIIGKSVISTMTNNDQNDIGINTKQHILHSDIKMPDLQDETLCNIVNDNNIIKINPDEIINFNFTLKECQCPSNLDSFMFELLPTNNSQTQSINSSKAVQINNNTNYSSTNTLINIEYTTMTNDPDHISDEILIQYLDFSTYGIIGSCRKLLIYLLYCQLLSVMANVFEGCTYVLNSQNYYILFFVYLVTLFIPVNASFSPSYISSLTSNFILFMVLKTPERVLGI